MTKNMTRKSLALGSAAALIATGFSALPANAAGLADTSFVSLAPTTGTSYTTLAGSSYTFSLSANEASTVTGGNLKFHVVDESDLIEPAVVAATETSSYRSVAVADNSVVLITVGSGATDTVRITDATLAAGLASGDLVYFTSDLNADDGSSNDLVIASDDTAFEVSVSGSNVTFTTDVDLSATTQNAVDGALSVRVLREARDTATDNDYVVDTGTNSASTTSVLTLKSDSAVTRSVAVTAWVDSNGNDVIDSTEYASPVRTVTFKKSSEVDVAVRIDAPLLGASAVTASVTTTPELNGPQVLAVDADAVAIGFTVQGIAGTNYDKDLTWDSVNNEFDGTIAPNAGAVTALSTAGTDWSANGSAVVAGTYSATGYLITISQKSSTASVAVAAVVADDIKASVAGTANITPGTSVSAAGSGTAITVRKGTTSVEVVADVYTSSGVLVGAGIPVTATYGTVVGTHKVNGSTAATSGTKTALTDANGRATFSVVSTSAANSDALPMTLVAQGVSGDAKQAEFAIGWATAAYEMVDLNDNGVAYAGTMVVDRSMNKGGSVTLDFAVVDQWGEGIAAGHRLRIATTGRTVGTTFATLVDGRASVTIADGGITSTTNGAIAATVTVEQADGTAELVAVEEFAAGEHGAFSIDVLDETNVVTLNADSSGNADDADAMALIALAAQDLRASNVATPAPGAVVTVVGTVKNATTADLREGAVVTISGDSEFLFQVGTRYAFGSLTFIADGSGAFEVNVLSNKAVTDSVITVTSNGASNTTAKKVSFTAAAADTGTTLVVDAPASALPGSTFQVTATLSDKYGNPVQVSTAGDVAVTYTGPGIVFGTLPNTTNAKGQLTFAVLLGANDKGTASITVSYDRNSDNDFTGTALPDLDIVKSVSVAVGAAAPSSDQKVNAGSFKGYVAIYAKGHEGKRLSAKVGNDWVVVPALASNFVRVVEYTGAGYTIAVRIYIDRVLVDTITVTTK